LGFRPDIRLKQRWLADSAEFIFGAFGWPKGISLSLVASRGDWANSIETRAAELSPFDVEDRAGLRHPRTDEGCWPTDGVSTAAN
jgi:hypothetical protein